MRETVGWGAIRHTKRGVWWRDQISEGAHRERRKKIKRRRGNVKEIEGAGTGV